MVTYDVIVEDWGDDPSPTITAVSGAFNQQGTWQFARGLRYGLIEICGDQSKVFVITRSVTTGEELDRNQITF